MAEYQLVAFIDKLHPGYSLDNMYIVLCCVVEREHITSCVMIAFNYSTLSAALNAFFARGANTQLDPSCASAPLASNVDLWNLITRCRRDASIVKLVVHISLSSWMFTATVMKRRVSNYINNKTMKQRRDKR